jgi:hypothetical protein
VSARAPGRRSTDPATGGPAADRARGGRGRGAAELAAIGRAKARLDRLALYPEPVRVDRVRILHTPWLFRIPGFRRFRGYEVGPLILIRVPLARVSDDLIVHELCHVWQDQHRRWRMWLSYLYRGYKQNPHEVEARRAVAETRAPTCP